MALLEVHDVVAGYLEGIDVLTGVSLTVERGSITGIIGANGAGKSTLLKTIFGFLHPRRGRIVLDGREIQMLPPHAVKRQGVSYVAQGASVFPQLTVQENLDLGAWVFRRDRARMSAMLERAWSAFPRLRDKRRSPRSSSPNPGSCSWTSPRPGYRRRSPSRCTRGSCRRVRRARPSCSSTRTSPRRSPSPITFI